MKRRRRKRWQAPPISQEAAKQVWAACFHGEGWPRGWRVEWAGFMRGALGLTVWSQQRIVLSFGDFAKAREAHKGGVLNTLVHEFVHVRNPKLRHGREFSRLVDAACERAGIAPVDTEHRERRITSRQAMERAVGERARDRWIYFTPEGWGIEVAGGLGGLFGWSR